MSISLSPHARHSFPLRTAFTLVELAVFMVILSMVAVNVVTMSDETSATAQSKGSKETLRKIEKALDLYFAANDAYPCPADLEALLGHNDFGEEDCTPSEVTNANAAGTGDDKTIFYGAVPTKILGLQPEDAADEWGGRIVYFVAEEATTDAGYRAMSHDLHYIEVFHQCAVDECGAGNLDSVVDGDDDVLTKQAVYALLSYGDDGFGGYSYSGKARDGESSHYLTVEEKVNFIDDAYFMDASNPDESQVAYDDLFFFKEKIHNLNDFVGVKSDNVGGTVALNGNVLLWLDAQDAETVVMSTVIHNEQVLQLVSQWKNKHVDELAHAQQFDIEKRPFYYANLEHSNHPYIRFDDTDDSNTKSDLLTISGVTFANANEFALFAVVFPEDPGTDENVIISTADHTNHDGFSFYIDNNNDSRLDILSGGGDAASAGCGNDGDMECFYKASDNVYSDNTSNVTKPQLYSINNSSTDLDSPNGEFTYFFRNADDDLDISTTDNLGYVETVINGAVSPQHATGGATEITIGYGDLDGTDEFFKGGIGEIILFDSALTVVAQREIECYLSQKWDLDLVITGTDCI